MTLGSVLPCDDSQLRVVQLTDQGFSLQVEGPPGTGKSQTIANIISNALYHGRKVLLVCDKKAAIVQVEERLSNCGLKPALLNLHDEDLDKREFLRQATEKFPPGQGTGVYPFNQLQETRKILNDRVRFGRSIAHPSLQVMKRDALAGLIQLRKELKSVPNVPIANWQSLSKERFGKLLGSLAEWPDLSAVLKDSKNVWNRVRVEAFDDPNTKNELQSLAQKILGQVDSLDNAREWAALVGIESPMNSDANVTDVLELITSVLERPACYPKAVGNAEITATELRHLQTQWERIEELIAARHPVPLEKAYSQEAEHEAKALLAAEHAQTWEDLSAREAYHGDWHDKIEATQKSYSRLCDQIGLVYSSQLKVRRAQLLAVLALGYAGTMIPHNWWKSDRTPVLEVAGWKAHIQACAAHAKNSPIPLHFVALERVAETHWKHVEAKAEHGFNFVSYCLHYVNDRKCKYALRQVFPSIPTRGFKQWQKITLHAVTALHSLTSLRNAAETHVILKQLTSAYLAVAHEGPEYAENFLSHEGVKALEKAAALVEQLQERNDLFEVSSIHWQTFWESVNQNLLSGAQSLLAELDSLVLPDKQESDDLERALEFYDSTRRRIRKFLHDFETIQGDRTNKVLVAFTAQKEFARCHRELEPLGKYLELQPTNKTRPDWKFLVEVVAWRDLFERLRAQQKLDMDSSLWEKIRNRFQEHQKFMAAASKELDGIFEHPLDGLVDYSSLVVRLEEILIELKRYPLWLEKRRWHCKISAFPEIKDLWAIVLEGAAPPEHCQRLFCFNLLRLCEPVAKPLGLEFKQTLNNFAAQDETLASWIIDHLKANLRKSMQEASRNATRSESELRRISGLQRIRGTVRELVNAHLDYLLAAKACWMMSPTSLANLIDSRIFEEHDIPFDLVIFDEASQIRVPDGLLSMAFGKQVIIVGDKNQLPPTDFFSSFANPDDDGSGFGISESLLHEFSGAFEPNSTQVMLMAHYRSETPDLIRFSNDWFYDGKLEMYPPAHVSGMGRRLHYVPDAIYSEVAGQRNNPREAKEIIKLIELHVKDCPDKSLGIVTMNIPQMELIDEMLQLQTSDQVRAFCADESRFFLRNLETVQGDEMDRIILSLTYGKNPAGHFSASVLGPLTKNGGERRLNVAITRSRSGLIVVSSLRVADLEMTNAQSRGFECLKSLLRDLELSEHARNYGISSERFKRRNDGVSNIVFCDSPFEEQVVEFLENEGYEVECQYGAGKFRLDIVVKDRGRNLLVIECDGASYHSSLVARTRDRARQRVLEKLGWRFHRVWSTNWWHFEEQEKEGIRSAIASARQFAQSSQKQPTPPPGKPSQEWKASTKTPSVQNPPPVGERTSVKAEDLDIRYHSLLTMIMEHPDKARVKLIISYLRKISNNRFTDIIKYHYDTSITNEEKYELYDKLASAFSGNDLRMFLSK